ncbi:MAG: hypothetical protein MUF60_09480 [Vicinamibacterales bacterium]|nr:hypothetical protein [Vicinamibacterales bacterium]
MIEGTAILRSAGGAERTVPLAGALDATAAERAHADAIAWVKALRHARVDGASLRDRFTCRGDSLWWFTELYLHKNARVLAWHAAAAAWRALVARESPATIEYAGGDASVALVGREVSRLAGIGWHGPAQLPEAWRRTLPVRLRARHLTWSALASRQRGSETGTASLAAGGVLAFVHTAFWRQAGAGEEGEEQYLGPVLREIEQRLGRQRLALVGVGPRTNFRARRWWHAAVEAGPHGRVLPVEGLSTRRDLGPSVAVWRDRRRHHATLLASGDLRERAVLGGCDLWPLVADELEGVTWLQWPWSARAMDEAGAALDRLAPSAVLTYAEAGGWGRAIVLEARRRGIPSVGVQHGFIYRHWMNYLHGERIVLVAAKYTQIRRVFRTVAEAAAGLPGIRLVVKCHPAETPEPYLLLLVVTKHAQMRRAFPALVRAVAAMPGVRLVVKCHPAETPEPYLRDAAGSSSVVVAPPSADLAALLAVASAVVTVNSTVAIDAMRLGVPALVVDLPNNLSPFVDAGVMIGAASLDTLAPALARLLDDVPARDAMAARQRAFLAEFGGPDQSGAAQRAAGEVLRLAGDGAR